jgi:hypothetical protein
MKRDICLSKLLVLGSFMLIPLTGFGEDGSLSQAAQAQASANLISSSSMDMQLKEIRSGLDLALEAAEASLLPHKPGSGHTKSYMKQVLGILKGSSDPGAGQPQASPQSVKAGVIAELEDLQRSLQKNEPSAATAEAIESTLAYMRETAKHAALSVAGSGVKDTHENARLTTGLLVAALGRGGSASPVSGAFAYASQAISQ